MWIIWGTDSPQSNLPIPSTLAWRACYGSQWELPIQKGKSSVESRDPRRQSFLPQHPPFGMSFPQRWDWPYLCWSSGRVWRLDFVIWPGDPLMLVYNLQNCCTRKIDGVTDVFNFFVILFRVFTYIHQSGARQLVLWGARVNEHTSR